jgi:pyridoxal phosphate enzyme (YggS family)
MTIAENIAAVREQIAMACKACNRLPAEVTLIAVSKTVEASRCEEAVRAGQPDLGENYAQELRDKASVVSGARWHFIGPLQRNKVKYVVGIADLIHSVDTRPLAEEIARRAATQGLVQRALIQVNIGHEPQKSGCSVDEVPSLLDACARLSGLKIEGLMCVPPADDDPRSHFRRLAELAKAARLPQLSMGMSADYSVAIAEGATMVRVGTAIFGTRPSKAAT